MITCGDCQVESVLAQFKELRRRLDPNDVEISEDMREVMVRQRMERLHAADVTQGVAALQCTVESLYQPVKASPLAHSLWPGAHKDTCMPILEWEKVHLPPPPQPLPSRSPSAPRRVVLRATCGL
jgi:hypothetical protein